MQPGTSGNVSTTPQRLEDGRWVTAPNARAAQRWRSRCYYVAEDDLVRRELVKYAGTKREAETFLSEELADRLEGTSDGLLTRSMMFVDAGQVWLTYIATRSAGLTAGTVRDYTHAWNRHVAAEGSILRRLTLAKANDPQRLLRFLQWVADTRGDGAQHMARTVVTGVLRYAVANGALTTNAMLQTDKIKVKAAVAKVSDRDHTRAFEPEELASLLDYAYLQVLIAKNTRVVRKAWATADLLCYMAGTGARIAEARRARWDDVNLETGEMTVRGTKNKSSEERRMTAPDWLLARLRHRAEREGTEGLIVAAPGTVEPQPEREWDQSNNSKAVRATLTGAGFDWAISHTLRRTGATMMLADGHDLNEVQAWLGHRPGSAVTRELYIATNRASYKIGMSSLA